MANATSSETLNKRGSKGGVGGGDSRNGVGAEDPNIEPFVPRRDHDPRQLRSWAKRTGFVSIFSGENIASGGGPVGRGNGNLHGSGRGSGSDLERGGGDGTSLSPKIEIDPVLGRTRPNRANEIEPDSSLGVHSNGRGDGNSGLRDGVGRGGDQRRGAGFDLPGTGVGLDDYGNRGNAHGNEHGVPGAIPAAEPNKDGGLGVNMACDGGEPTMGRPTSSPGIHELKCGVTDNPGFVPLSYYGLQHYLSLAGSLVFMPLVMVPTMGGTDKDTANVISTMLLVSGITTLVHSFLGTRLPLIQGSSFVYLAPALVIMNSDELRNLTEHKFRYIMRELQGAIILGSVFQCILGFSGLMSLLLRWINPVVVSPTIAAVGLAYFSFGFPQAGSCVEISIPQILLLLLFTLYLRGVSIAGHQIFRIYAVPLSVIIVWAYAFFLTTGGAYNYNGCNPNIPSSNMLIDTCRRHAYTMKYCRTDVSDAWTSSSWVRVPYPLQWGIPIFHLRTSLILVIVSCIASVDSVGTYHLMSVRANSKPPTPGIVSRGIGVEGFCSILAGLWGTGAGSTTLTENVHTIYITKVANRRAVQLGAALLIFLSTIGKVGGLLASIPLALAASVLCFIWALIVALGLSNLQYCQASSSRNMTIVGVSLFLGLSIPAYFQQYQPLSRLILPAYLVPYGAASSGPVQSGNAQLDFAINGLLSLSMVVTFFIAFVLDNTVPGSQQERGVYLWSNPQDMVTDPASLANYMLPRRVVGFFCWAKCLGG